MAIAFQPAWGAETNQIAKKPKNKTNTSGIHNNATTHLSAHQYSTNSRDVMH